MSATVSQQNNKVMRTIAILGVVALGHLAAGWVISHMKVPELPKPKEVKPLEVKIITEQPKPKPKVEPPKPKQLEKPKPEPKPEPKPQPPKVEPKPQPKPKVTPPKPVPQKVVQTKTESPKPQRTAIEVPPATVKTVETPKVVEVPPATVKTVETPKVVEVPPATVKTVETPKVETPKASPTPVQVSEGNLAWRSKPYIDPANLANHIKKAESDTVSVTVAFVSDAKGKIVSATITKSSGVPSLDNYVQARVKAARLQEYKPNGVATPVKSTQNFVFHKPKS